MIKLSKYYMLYLLLKTKSNKFKAFSCHKCPIYSVMVKIYYKDNPVPNFCNSFLRDLGINKPWIVESCSQRLQILHKFLKEKEF